MVNTETQRWVREIVPSFYTSPYQWSSWVWISFTPHIRPQLARPKSQSIEGYLQVCIALCNHACETIIATKFKLRRELSMKIITLRYNEPCSLIPVGFLPSHYRWKEILPRTFQSLFLFDTLTRQSTRVNMFLFFELHPYVIETVNRQISRTKLFEGKKKKEKKKKL